MSSRSNGFRRRLPVLFAAIGLCTLALVAPAEASHRTVPPGCQPDRRTVEHSAGVNVGTGSYQPCLVDTGMTSGESGLAISRDGTLLRSVATNPLGIAVSTDDGASWTRRPLPSSTSSAIADGYVDPVTDRYFYSAAFATPVLGSDNLGKSWDEGTFDSAERQDWNKVFSGRPVTPRASGYPTNTYYCNWTTPFGIASQTRCYKSIDGGRVFTSMAADPYANATCADPAQIPGTGHGRGIVDPRDGTIYLPVSYCGAREVAVSHDEGASWTRRVIAPATTNAILTLFDGLTSPSWLRQLGSGRLNVVNAELSSSSTSDGLAIDGSGRLHAVWIDGRSYLPQLSHSGDGGQTWSKPVAFNPPGVVQAVLPSIAVTRAGRVGISYYGTTDKWNWTGYLAITDDAAGSSPTFDTAAVTRPGQPLMPEPCCWASGPQEYTAVRWAPDGSLWAAFAGSTASSTDAKGVLGRLVRARR